MGTFRKLPNPCHSLPSGCQFDCVPAPRPLRERAVKHLNTVLALALCTSVVSAADWNEFRGPGGQGHFDAKGLPVEWSATKNVAWHSAVPGEGWSSPVVV